MKQELIKSEPEQKKDIRESETPKDFDAEKTTMKGKWWVEIKKEVVPPRVAVESLRLKDKEEEDKTLKIEELQEVDSKWKKFTKSALLLILGPLGGIAPDAPAIIDAIKGESQKPKEKEVRGDNRIGSKSHNHEH